MIDNPIHYLDLKKLVGGTSIDDVCARLDQQKIKYLIGPRGRPFTTMFAINTAMGLTSPGQPDTTPDVEID